MANNCAQATKCDPRSKTRGGDMRVRFARAVRASGTPIRGAMRVRLRSHSEIAPITLLVLVVGRLRPGLADLERPALRFNAP